MQNELTLALIQSDLVWENPAKNRLNFTNKIEGIRNSVDLIILPEMFSTGFTMSPKKVAETMQGETVKWMQDLAKDMQMAIMGSLVITENGHYYNRLLFVHPEGLVDVYDKRHTFTLAGEHKVYRAGKQKLIVNYKGFKIRPLICYDLRFPVWSRITEGYDVLIYVANWPKQRISAWDALLKARAIENMSYCVGVNRVGFDMNDHEYTGSSAVYDVLGEEITNIPKGVPSVEIVSLNKSHIKKYREKLQFLKDQDDFNLVV